MDKRRIQEVLGLMTKNLECSICLELLNNPISTKCDHQFCRFCMTQFLNKKRSVPCPLCKKPVTERSLQEREELANIVKHVRDLINSFQEDSGDIFTPPRGPSISPFSPATPEPLVPQNNVRRHTRRGNSSNGHQMVAVDTASELSSIANTPVDKNIGIPVVSSSNCRKSATTNKPRNRQSSKQTDKSTDDKKIFTN